MAEGRTIEEPGPARRPILWAAIALALLVAGVFFPILGFEFVEYDVPGHVIENPCIRGLTGDNLKRIFTSRCVTSYYPVRTLTYAIDYQFWGLNPAGFKLTNGLIHLANVLLVFWLVLRLFARRAGATQPVGAWDVFLAAFSAGVFAIHPVVVEPVAWVPGREELLMTLGALGCFHFHLTARGLAQRGAHSWWTPACHAAAALCCAAACLSNAVAAVIPLLIVAWDLLTLPRPKLGKILTGTAALWVIGAITVLIKTAERDVIGLPGVPWAERLMIVPNVYWLNLKTLIWPRELVLVYPHAVPESLFDTEVMLGGAAILLTGAALWMLRRRGAIVFGLLWFCLALGPSSQIMTHQIHRADRFLYLPLAGLAVAVAAGLRPLQRALAGRVAAIVIAAAGTLGLLAILSAGQVQTWRNTLTVWSNSLGVYPNHPTAHAGIAYQLARSGQMPRAVEHYELSIALQPNSVDVLKNFALDLTACPDEAHRDYGRAIEVAEQACRLTGWKDPELRRTLATVHARYAQALADRGELDKARQHRDAAIEAQGTPPPRDPG